MFAAGVHQLAKCLRGFANFSDFSKRYILNRGLFRNLGIESVFPLGKCLSGKLIITSSQALLMIPKTGRLSLNEWALAFQVWLWASSRGKYESVLTTSNSSMLRDGM